MKETHYVVEDGRVVASHRRRPTMQTVLALPGPSGRPNGKRGTA